MNIRNIQIFGWKEFKYWWVVVLAVIMVASGLFYSFTRSSDGVFDTGQGNEITGSAVSQAPLEEPTLESQETSVSLPPEPIAEEKPLTYKDFQEQCAYDMKQADDDIIELSNEIEELKKKIDELKSQYDAKESELESLYKIPLEISQDKQKQLEQHLENAKEQLDLIKSQCSG